MQVNITARHLELTPAIASYVTKKLEKCEKYFDNLIWAQMILVVEKYRQLVLHAGNMTFRAKDESIDLYAAIDLVVDKMDKQLKKYKEISKTKRKTSLSASYKAAALIKNRKLPLNKANETFQLITETKSFDVKPQTIREAVDQMESLGYSFFMFLNEKSEQINLVYRRENGTYGLIEPRV
jgi:putative sigma-54 modulation protein